MKPRPKVERWAGYFIESNTLALPTLWWMASGGLVPLDARSRRVQERRHDAGRTPGFSQLRALLGCIELREGPSGPSPLLRQGGEIIQGGLEHGICSGQGQNAFNAHGELRSHPLAPEAQEGSRCQHQAVYGEVEIQNQQNHPAADLRH